MRLKNFIKQRLPHKLLLFKSRLHQLIQSVRDRISSEDIIQLAPTTYLDRHPDIFEFCKQYFNSDTPIKILSFGCSTGEEIITLKKYFPNAIIYGCDINKKSLKFAQQKNSDSNVYYFFSDDENIREYGPFDVIFSLSVLCKEPEARYVDNISNYFAFKQFNNIVKLLHDNLNKRGLLVIRNSNYRVEDTAISTHYKIIKYTESDFPLFDREGHKIIKDYRRGEIFLKNTNYQIVD